MTPEDLLNGSVIVYLTAGDRIGLYLATNFNLYYWGVIHIFGDIV